MFFGESFYPPEIGFVKVGIVEVGFCQIRVSQIGFHEEGVFKVGTDEKGIFKIRFDQIGVLKVGAVGIGSPQDRLIHVAVLQVGLVHPGFFQVDIQQEGVEKVGIIQVGAGEYHIIEFCFDQMAMRKINIVDLIPVQPLDVTHRAECSFFRFPQSEVIDLIFIGFDAKSLFPGRPKPDQQDTDDQQVEQHAVGLRQDLPEKTVEMIAVIRIADGNDDD